MLWSSKRLFLQARSSVAAASAQLIAVSQQAAFNAQTAAVPDRQTHVVFLVAWCFGVTLNAQR